MFLNIDRWWSRKWTGLCLIVLTLLGLSGLIYALTNNIISIGYNDGYQPDQPIPFSHKLHVGKYKMDCRYCHTSVEESRHASIPSLEICMNCHLNIKTNSPVLKKLRKHFDENRPVRWKKVHLLPDFVRFHHAPHIKALSQKGDLSFIPDKRAIRQSCYACHGVVENMDIIRQESNLSMGWCVNCHRQQENEKLNQCSTCHY